MKRFWDKVNIRGKDECWNWAASSRGNEYGCFKYQNKVIDAHRFVWFLTYGYFPEKLVCHKCDNRKCVNPKHLFLGSYLDNLKDSINKGRDMGKHLRKVITDGKAWCSGHQDYILINNFGKDKNRANGLKSYCKECINKKI